jgi:hypothetical protein
MMCLKFLILEPRGSRPVASSINGRLFYLLLSLPDADWGIYTYKYILITLGGVIGIILIVSTSVTDQTE